MKSRRSRGWRLRHSPRRCAALKRAKVGTAIGSTCCAVCSKVSNTDLAGITAEIQFQCASKLREVNDLRKRPNVQSLFIALAASEHKAGTGRTEHVTAA